VGKDGKLFSTDASSLRDYVHGKDGGSFKPKDFRTAKASETAVAEIKKMPMPKSEKEYKASVRKIAKFVSDRLGNTPTVALQSYIPPTVFSGWRASLKGGTNG
jgi:DNA topoisomerase-1